MSEERKTTHRREYRKAWVSKRRKPGGRCVYDIRWYDSQGRRHSRMIGSSLADARKAAAAKTEELNTVGDVAGMRWGEFVKLHLGFIGGNHTAIAFSRSGC